MKYTWDEIQNIMHSRRSLDATLIANMLDTRDRYNADIVIPLPDVDGEPSTAPLSPQIIHDGIEGTAMRAASVMPTVSCPALDPAKDRGKRSREYASIRRRAVYSNWNYNLIQLQLARVYRHLTGYGTMSMVVLPDYKAQRAKIETRSPLSTYADPRNFDDYQPPLNCGFVYGKSKTFLSHCYGYELVDKLVGEHPEHDGLWDIVEWIDEDDIVIGVLGPRSPFGIDMAVTSNVGMGGVELRRWPNRSGVVPVAVGRRITLDRVAGQMEIVTGAADWLDRLMTLNVIAAERNIFPDMYALAEEGRSVELAGGEWKDGRSGEINLLNHTKAVGQLISSTGPMTQTVLAQLERSARSSGGATPLFGGENPGGLRTGRALSTMGDFSVDPRVAEMQHVVEAAFSRCINPAILEIEKGYWPGKKYVVFSGMPTDDTYVEYTPKVHFEATENSVRYSYPGMDLSSVSVAVLQLAGGDLMSKHTARTSHPMIENPDHERLTVIEERIEEALLVGTQQQITQGALPLADAARVKQLVAQGNDLAQALLIAQREAQERQAEIAPPAEEGQLTSPEAQPGLSLPNQGIEQSGTPSVPQLPAGQQNLRDLLRAVKTR